MNIARLKVRRLGANEDAAFWTRSLSGGAWLPGSRVLKQDAATWVRRVTLPGRTGDVVIKCRPAQGLGERLKALSRASRGDRHWRGARWLLDHGFDTAEPLLLASAVVDGVPCELLLTAFIDARSVLEHLAARDLSVRQEHEAARAVARLVGGIDKAGRHNRDGKPSNLLLVPDVSGFYRVATIDTVAIRRGAGFKPLARSLANLLIEPMGTGVAPRLALQGRIMRELLGAPPTEANERDDWWLTRGLYWGTARDMVDAHGDPTPRVNPLGP
jgi:hypothetical protein